MVLLLLKSRYKYSKSRYLMADAPEEIIIIEDSDAALYDNDSQKANFYAEDDEVKRKKIILFGGIALIIVLIIAATIVLLSLKSSKQETSVNMNFIDKKIKESKKEPVMEPSKLENMIAKANYLYSNGSKEKALSLYEKIATYSEAVSEYNLGVARLKDGQYALALKTFQKAIQNNEKRCVSAINAAVCSLHLNDQESFLSQILKYLMLFM